MRWSATHTDPIAPVILGVTGILFFALVGRYAARKLGVSRKCLWERRQRFGIPRKKSPSGNRGKKASSGGH